MIQKTAKETLSKFIGKMETSGKVTCKHQKNVIVAAKKMRGHKKGPPARAVRLARYTSFFKVTLLKVIPLGNDRDSV